MAKTRIVPHRPGREEAKAKELADLRRENHKLRRDVKRLEKEIRKRAEVEEEVIEQGLEEAEKETVQTCAKCHSGTIKVVNLAGRLYQVCVECKDRKRVDNG